MKYEHSEVGKKILISVSTEITYYEEMHSDVGKNIAQS